MDKIIFMNSRNESIEFSSLPPYKLMAIEGLGGLDNNINSEKSPFQHGTTYLNSNTDVRRIMFDVLIMSNNIKEKRREISRVLNPTLREGTLSYIYSDGEIKTIKCVVESAPKFVHSPKHPAERFQVTQFTLYCPSPFWEDYEDSIEEMKAFINKFRFPLTLPTEMGGEGSKVSIFNAGNVPTPVYITFKGACVNPVIRNLTTGEFIRINRELKADDVLTINTEFGNKQIRINGENAYSSISLDSTLWELAVGDNLITYETDSGAKNANVTITYRNRYVGI